MYRVTYTSHASGQFTLSALATISAVSRRNNAKVGVSGLLIYHDRRFFQVLEGEEPVLTQLMGRIAADPRHLGLEIVDHGPINQRAFVSWKMCCAPDGVPASVAAVSVSLQELVPVHSDLRGNDPKVRKHVRRFLAQLSHLPLAVAG